MNGVSNDSSRRRHGTRSRNTIGEKEDLTKTKDAIPSTLASTRTRRTGKASQVGKGSILATSQKSNNPTPDNANDTPITPTSVEDNNKGKDNRVGRSKNGHEGNQSNGRASRRSKPVSVQSTYRVRKFCRRNRVLVDVVLTYFVLHPPSFL